MLDQDPFRKKGKGDISDIFKRDQYSIQRDHNQQDEVILDISADSGRDEKSLHSKRTRAWVIGGMLVMVSLILLAVFFGFDWYRSNAFSNDRVSILLEGEDVASGDDVQRFVLIYENKNNVALQNAVILLRFPDNFVIEEGSGLKRDGTTSARLEVGTIGAQKQATVEFYGYFSGTTVSSVYIRSILQYSPKNISGLFQQEAQKSIKMGASAVDVSMDLPIELSTGDLTEVMVQYTNRGTETLFSTRLQMEYPEGFTYQEADKEPSEGNTVWYLGSLEPGDTQTLKLRGRIEGDRNVFKQFSAIVGVVRGDNSFAVYGKDERKVQIINSPFAIQIKINKGGRNSVTLGERVGVILSYANEGDVGFRDAIVQVALDGQIFDDTQLTIGGGGSYNASTRTITWRASDIPLLDFVDPRESGTIEFTLPMKQSIPMVTGSDTRLKGSIRASIDSVDIPNRIGTRRIVAQDWMEFMMTSTISLVTDLREASTNTPLSKVDFEVGKETELVVYTRLRNTYNDVVDGKFILDIPSGVTFIESIPLEKDEVVSYEERSQRLVWEVGKVTAGTGIIFPDRVIAFRLRVTPQEQQGQNSLTLIRAMKFSGKDDFTGDAISILQGDVVSPRISAKASASE